MTIKTIVEELVKLSPRFATGEEATAQYISNFLIQNKIPFVDQPFETTVPVAEKAELVIDGVLIECRNVGCESGVFDSKNSIVSSMYWGDDDYNRPQNINFNPQCKGTVSMAQYYKKPALAIKSKDVQKVINAETVKGQTVVKPYSFTGHNFLVGNISNPKSIIFTHYDCWESGAIDNASGTAVLLHLVLTTPSILKDDLFVIAGNEEISYDDPVYWGKGYRAFEEEYKKITYSSENLICVDCVGYSEHTVYTDPDLMKLGLPLTDLDKLLPKCKLLIGDVHRLFDVYHSNDDTPELVNEKMLKDAQNKLLSLL